MFDYRGLTIREIIKKDYHDLNPSRSIMLFMLRDKDDKSGRMIDENFNLKTIVKIHPEILDCTVMRQNDFYGNIVLRVLNLNLSK